MDISCAGYCPRCGEVHSLGADHAKAYCLDLIRVLDEKKRLDFTVCESEAEPNYSTSYLFGEARGQMFGIMVCEDQNGDQRVLKAFSGQYDGIWEVEGWVPPLFEIHEFYAVNYQREREIKMLGRLIENFSPSSIQRKELVFKRKQLSRRLMKDIHGLYKITNFRGETRRLNEIFSGGKGMPAGTGDCCAPKLLNHAAQNGLTPLGLAEFFFGKENKSARRQHGSFYGSCQEKCQPILGFMLCGLQNENER